MLFLNKAFRAFLKERQEAGQDFLALVANPARGTKNEKFAVAIKGLERLYDQANKPEDSYEMAATQLAEPIFKPGSFEPDRWLNPKHARKGHVGRVLKRFPQFRHELEGILYAIDYFARSSLPTTTLPSTGSPERYDTLLQNVQSNHKAVKEKHAKRIEQILRVQQQQLPEAQHGRRAAIRKVLGTGQWQKEDWTDENLRLYLDVVHAWNCTINRNIAPEAGSLYETTEDIPLSTYQRVVTDAIGWFRAGPMPATGLSDRIRLFLSWDPLDADWKKIAFIVRETQETARKLQAALKARNQEDCAEALDEHASRIADYVSPIQPKDIPEYVWWISKTVLSAMDNAPAELVDFFQEFMRGLPYARALMHARLVVNTLKGAGREILPLPSQGGSEPLHRA